MPTFTRKFQTAIVQKGTVSFIFPFDTPVIPSKGVGEVFLQCMHLLKIMIIKKRENE